MIDFPEDVMRAAEEAARDECQAGGSFDYRCVVETAARAILAERERCAKLAEGTEQTRSWVPSSLYDTLRREAAAAIRKGAAS
jgi:hypothetical protein